MVDETTLPVSEYLQQLLESIAADRAQLAVRRQAETGSPDELGVDGLIRARIDAGLALAGRLVFEQWVGEPREPLVERASAAVTDDVAPIAEDLSEEPDAASVASSADAATDARAAPVLDPALSESAAIGEDPVVAVPLPAVPAPAAAPILPMTPGPPRAVPRAMAASARPVMARPAQLTEEALGRLRAGLRPKLERTEPSRYRAISSSDQTELKLSLKMLGRTPKEIRDTGDLFSELGILDDAIGYLLGSWARLPSECNHALTSLLTCRARAVQEAAAALGAAAEEPRINTIFPRLSRHSTDSRPGHVYGLARHHAPESGSWLEDARVWEQRIRSLIEPEPPTRQTLELTAVVEVDSAAPAEPVPADRTRRRAVRAKLTRSNPGRQAAPTVPESWPLWSTIVGRRAALVGGEPRVEAAERLKEAFGLKEIEWIADASGAGRRVDSLIERMRSGTVNLVIVLRAFTSHKTVDKVWSVEARDCIRVLADSYGVTQVRLGCERFLSRQSLT